MLRARLRCPRCGGELDDAPGALRCREGHVDAPFDGRMVDFAPESARPRTLGAWAMQSSWLSHIYERWWRPVAFGISTGFRMPSPEEEARIVLDRLAGAAGPWLDLSCGPGSLTEILTGTGISAVALDASAAMLARAREHAPKAFLVRADAAALPFADETFGAVINMAALDLYPDAARVVTESARVLAPGGTWLASTFLSSPWVTGSASLRRALAITTGIHAVSERSLPELAASAGLTGFGEIRFGRYILAWAEKAAGGRRIINQLL